MKEEMRTKEKGGKVQRERGHRVKTKDRGKRKRDMRD